MILQRPPTVPLDIWQTGNDTQRQWVIKMERERLKLVVKRGKRGKRVKRRDS